jgi:hypothetical protein
MSPRFTVVPGETIKGVSFLTGVISPFVAGGPKGVLDEVHPDKKRLVKMIANEAFLVTLVSLLSTYNQSNKRKYH